MTGGSADEIADYAGRLYDYHRQHPDLARLLQWEALTLSDEVPEEQLRREYYGHKTSALAAGQAEGTVTTVMAPSCCTSCCCPWRRTGRSCRKWLA